MKAYSNPLSSKQPVPASRKAIIYLGTATSIAGAIIFFSGFFTFGAGFIEFIKPGNTPSMPRSDPSQSFEESRRQSEEWWSQIEAQGRQKEQVFFQMVAATLSRAIGSFALIFAGV